MYEGVFLTAAEVVGLLINTNDAHSESKGAGMQNSQRVHVFSVFISYLRLSKGMESRVN